MSQNLPPIYSGLTLYFMTFFKYLNTIALLSFLIIKPNNLNPI